MEGVVFTVFIFEIDGIVGLVGGFGRTGFGSFSFSLSFSFFTFVLGGVNVPFPGAFGSSRRKSRKETSLIDIESSSTSAKNLSQYETFCPTLYFQKHAKKVYVHIVALFVGKAAFARATGGTTLAVDVAETAGAPGGDASGVSSTKKNLKTTQKTGKTV